ncbi:MAG: site-specific integrase [Euryarchaeota archaeon]|nr:site-specific integrase [Euryarchaeota archaeon]
MSDDIITTSAAIVNMAECISSANGRQDIPAPRRETTNGQAGKELLLSGERWVNYPFFDGIGKYLAENLGGNANSTYKERERKLKRIGCLLEELKEKDPTIHTNPEAIDKAEIFGLIRLMREKNIQPSTQGKYLQILDYYLKYNKNYNVNQLRMIHRNVWPKEINKPIKHLSFDEIGQLVEASNKMTGWWGCVARFATLVYLQTGMRPTELRVSNIEDLNMETSTIFVSCPKGVNTYGDKRTIWIPDLYHEALTAYLKERETYLQENQATCKKLIPHIYPSGKVDCWSQGLWTKLRQRICRHAGVQFKWKDLRSTYANIAINVYGSTVEEVKVFLGHSTTETTEKYYARLESGNAQERYRLRFTEAMRKGIVPILPAPEGKVKIQNGSTRI